MATVMKLGRCPHCDGIPGVHKASSIAGGGVWWIECDECGAKTDKSFDLATASSYTLREYNFKGKPSSYIEEKKADIDNAENWRSGGYEKPLAVSRKTFAMLIEVKTIGKARRFLADNDCRLEELGDMKQGEWCLAEQEAELVEDAKKVLLEEMDDAIKRLKDKEAKEASE